MTSYCPICRRGLEGGSGFAGSGGSGGGPSTSGPALPRAENGFGGGGGGCELVGDCGAVLSSLCLPSSGGSGGTGGGLAFGCLDCVCCSCLATTGGSLEKMSCSMEKNSNNVEVYGPRISDGHVFAKVLLPMCCRV